MRCSGSGPNRNTKQTPAEWSSEDGETNADRLEDTVNVPKPLCLRSPRFDRRVIHTFRLSPSLSGSGAFMIAAGISVSGGVGRLPFYLSARTPFSPTAGARFSGPVRRLKY